MNRCSAVMIIGFLLCGFAASGQTKAEWTASKRLYEGRWVNKKAQRHLSISFDGGDYVTINDWHGKWSDDNQTIDAYKAFVNKGILVMPEDKTDLRCPYCEIVKKEKSLLYRCRGMNAKDKRFVDQILFVRERD